MTTVENFDLVPAKVCPNSNKKVPLKVLKIPVMIQRQQCVACNLMIPDSESTDMSCTCGHVYKEIKLIGGKRFSEYRAQLYLRLENRKQRSITGENKPFGERAQNKGKIEHICLLEGSCSHCPKTEKGARSDVIRREKEPFIRPKVIRRQPNQSHHLMKSKLSESKNTSTLGNLQRRFPIALTEINRRLVSQNQLWSSLDNRHKVVTDR